MSGKIEYGDNLPHLREMAEWSVDLVYLDPPFNSGRDYTIVVEESLAHEQAYQDTWTWDAEAQRQLKELEAGHVVSAKVGALLRSLWEQIGGNGTLAYLVMMAPRLIELHRVLKQTGSLYLHCDPTASHYLKIVLDLIFGPNNMRGEIIWRRASSHNNAKRPGPIHDVIFLYTKSDKYTWNHVCHEADDNFKNCDGEDAYGRWIRENLTAPGERKGSSGQAWRGIELKNRHWQIPTALVEMYETQTETPLEAGTTQERLDRLEEAGLIVWSKNGNPGYKKYLGRGRPLQDIWDDIHHLKSSSEEYEDFEGQKPTRLIERIIAASSHEGDLVLDPFLGSGTTAIAAERLKRNWIGFELTDRSGRLAQNRLDKEFGEGVYLRSNRSPADIDHAKVIAREDPYLFQCWVVKQLQGLPGPRGRDQGVDGNFRMKGFADNKSHPGIISVKGGATGVNDVRAFCTVVQRKKATAGLFVAFRNFITSGMREEAGLAGTFSSGFEEDRTLFDRVQVIAVEDLFDRARPFGGAKLPGFIEKPDFSETKQAITRNQQEGFHFAMAWED